MFIFLSEAKVCWPTFYSLGRSSLEYVMDVGTTISSVPPALRRAAFQASRSNSRNSMLSYAVFNESNDSLAVPLRSRPATPVSSELFIIVNIIRANVTHMYVVSNSIYL